MAPPNAPNNTTGLQGRWFGSTIESLKHALNVCHFAVVELLYDIESFGPLDPWFIEQIVLQGRETSLYKLRSIDWVLKPVDWEELLFACTLSSHITRLRVRAPYGSRLVHDKQTTAGMLIAILLNATAGEIDKRLIRLEQSTTAPISVELLRRFSIKAWLRATFGPEPDFLALTHVPFLLHESICCIPVENLTILAGLCGDLDTIRIIVDYPLDLLYPRRLAHLASCLFASILTMQRECSPYLVDKFNRELRISLLHTDVWFIKRDLTEWKVLRNILAMIRVMASARGEVGILRSLFEIVSLHPDIGASIELPNVEGKITPIMAALLGGSFDTVEYLWNLGASLVGVREKLMKKTIPQTTAAWLEVVGRQRQSNQWESITVTVPLLFDTDSMYWLNNNKRKKAVLGP